MPFDRAIVEHCKIVWLKARQNETSLHQSCERCESWNWRRTFSDLNANLLSAISLNGMLSHILARLGHHHWICLRNSKLVKEVWRRRTHCAKGTPEEDIMTEVKEAAPVSKVLARDPNKQWEWSIELDKHLRRLIDSESIEDPDVQMVVCEALQALGLVEHRLFGEDTNTLESQHH